MTTSALGACVVALFAYALPLGCDGWPRGGKVLLGDVSFQPGKQILTRKRSSARKNLKINRCPKRIDGLLCLRGQKSINYIAPFRLRISITSGAPFLARVKTFAH